jgi:hypothetical protein
LFWGGLARFLAKEKAALRAAFSFARKQLTNKSNEPKAKVASQLAEQAYLRNPLNPFNLRSIC